MRKNFRNTSWQKVAPWYGKLTEGGGHYYHQHVVIPETLKLLQLGPKSKLLDIACGNGVLGKAIPKEVEYVGLDLSESLIKMAKRDDRNFNHKYIVGNATKPFQVSKDFTHAVMILALQNIAEPAKAIKNAAEHLILGGKFVIVLNHPTFRIPRQSSWEIDNDKKTQFRRIDRYMSPMEIPVNMNPSDRNSEVTWSYHFPLYMYSKMLQEAGFVIELIEEWTSDKESEGRSARMENRSRNEFPLFMAIRAKKI